MSAFAPNELTSGDERDWLAGTPFHKHVKARVQAVTTDDAVVTDESIASGDTATTTTANDTAEALSA